MEYPPHVGGVARSAHRLVHGLARAGWEVAVFVVVGERERYLKTNDNGVWVQELPIDLTAIDRMLKDEDARHAFDLFHGFVLVAAYPCFRIAATGDRPVIASIRGKDGLTFDDMSRDVSRRAHWITSVSGDSLTRAAAVAPGVAARSCVIPNGIDIRRFTAWQPTSANAGVVGTVATFRPKKNIPLLLAAYARLPREIRRQLLLVGEAYDGAVPAPAFRAELDGLIDALEIRDETAITGLVEHSRIPDYHARMRSFVLSSDHEGMPNAVLEAAASGLPIVATAVDGVKDMLTNGRDALLVSPNDPEALASAIARVLTDQDLACQLGAEARRTAERLSASVELQRYLDLYESLIAGRFRMPVTELFGP